MSDEGYIAVSGGNIWYRMEGDNAGIPLVLIHGGPGYTHHYLNPLEELAIDRPVIFYDQLGCGKSDKPDDKELWTVQRFRAELHDLISALGLEGVHLFGHSWGGLLAAEYALAYPDTIQSIILASPCLSTSRWEQDASKLIKLLPEDMQEAIRSHEPNGRTPSQQYYRAEDEYERRFLCRIDPPPPPLQESITNLNWTMYETMWGPSEFLVTGTLKNYDCTNRLHELRGPVLYTCGRYDEATPEAVAWYSSLTPISEMVVFEHSAHMPHLEETESYLSAIREYLQRMDHR